MIKVKGYQYNSIYRVKNRWSDGMELSNVPEIFGEYLVRVKMSKKESTFKRYLYDLLMFAQYANDKLGKELDEDFFSSINDEDYEDFFFYCSETKKLKSMTIKRIFSVIKGFVDFENELNNRGWTPPEPLTALGNNLEQKIEEDDLLFEKDVLKVLYGMEKEKNLTTEERRSYGYIKNRNKAILALLFFNGLTLDEVVSLNMNDIHFAENIVGIRTDCGVRPVIMAEMI